MNKVEVIEINQGAILNSDDLKKPIQSKLEEYNKAGYKVLSTEIIKNKKNPGREHAESLFMVVILEKI